MRETKKNYNIRLNDNVIIALQKKAEKAKTNVSVIIRNAIDSFLNINFVDRLKIFEALIISIVKNAQTFSNIGSNLNQIAFQLNTKQDISIEEIKETLERLEKQNKIMKKEYGKIYKLILSMDRRLVK